MGGMGGMGGVEEWRSGGVVEWWEAENAARQLAARNAPPPPGTVSSTSGRCNRRSVRRWRSRCSVRLR